MKTLSVLFDEVADPNDWRAEINAVIPISCFDEYNEAVEIYTGTSLVIGEGFDLKTQLEPMVEVRAIGYRDGPCGP